MGRTSDNSNMFSPRLVICLCVFFFIGMEAAPKPEPKPKPQWGGGYPPYNPYNRAQPGFQMGYNRGWVGDGARYWWPDGKNEIRFYEGNNGGIFNNMIEISIH